VSKDEAAVFVIAPDGVTVHVRKADIPVLRFASSAEFERWRRGSSARVEAAVDAVLGEMGIDLSSCSARTQEIILHLRERESVPSVKELVAGSSSRRSFYRSWSDDIREMPAVFLDRVRLRHLHAAAPPSAAQHGTSDDLHGVR
jgi:hypothetical protein